MKPIYRVRYRSGTIAFRTNDALVAGAYASTSPKLAVSHTPTMREIRDMKAGGLTEQGARQMAAGMAGVYGVAFFGHKGTHEDRRIVAAINKKIVAIYG
jgi:hypothetical protein